VLPCADYVKRQDRAEKKEMIKELKVGPLPIGRECDSCMSLYVSPKVYSGHCEIDMSSGSPAHAFSGGRGGGRGRVFSNIKISPATTDGPNEVS